MIRMDERVAHYAMRQFHNHSNHRAPSFHFFPCRSRFLSISHVYAIAFRSLSSAKFAKSCSFVDKCVGFVFTRFVPLFAFLFRRFDGAMDRRRPESHLPSRRNAAGKRAPIHRFLPSSQVNNAISTDVLLFIRIGQSNELIEKDVSKKTQNKNPYKALAISV